MNLKSIYWHLILHAPQKLLIKIVGMLSPQEALDTANAVLDVFPADQLATVLKVIGLYGLNRLDEAFALSTEAIVQYPRSITLNGLRGDILLQKDQTDAALLAYDNVLAEQPDHAAALLHRASILGDMGHTDLALTCYDEVIGNERNTTDNIMFACIQKGSIFIQNDRIAELQRFSEELLQKYDGNPAVLSMVGAFQCSAGLPDEGLKYYEQALDYAKPNAAMAERLRAIIGTIDSKNGPAVSDPPGTPK